VAALITRGRDRKKEARSHPCRRRIDGKGRAHGARWSGERLFLAEIAVGMAGGCPFSYFCVIPLALPGLRR
jgi:hypothetical protein